MSYSHATGCYNCRKKDEGCTDGEQVQAAIDEIHSKAEGHLGYGTIVHQCSAMIAKT